MTHDEVDRWLASWIIALTGIVFNPLAVVKTHYFIGLNSDDIQLIERNTSRNQALIGSQDNRASKSSAGRNFFILVPVRDWR